MGWVDTILKPNGWGGGGPTPRPPKPKPKAKVVTSGAGAGRASTGKTASKTPSQGGYHTAAEQEKYYSTLNKNVSVPQREYQDWLDQNQPAYVDPYNGLSPLDAMLMGMNQNGGGSGSGGGGSGGSGGSSAADLAAQKAAYQQMLAAYDYQNAANDESFDARSKSLTDLQGQGDARLAALVSQLAASRDSARTGVQSSYANTDAQLQVLQAQQAQNVAGREAGANRTLQAFGADPTVSGGGNAALDQLMAARMQNTQLGGAADASFANRSNVYNGLTGDASMQYQNMYTQLQAQLQAQRQQAAIAAAQQRAALGIEAAKNGVQL